MENLLHYVWKYKLYNNLPLRTTQGDEVKVIDPGYHNQDAGPDFFNAKLKIGTTLWAGNVEIHTRSSDWIRHNHQCDRAYNSIILHVVSNNDSTVYNQEGREVVQLIIEYPESLRENYMALLNSESRVACEARLDEIDSLHWFSWKGRLLTERLESKCRLVEEHLRDSCGDWEGAFYTLLGRSFGFSINSDPFERLVRAMPYSIVHKHSDSILTIEALLFGQAGLLSDGSIECSYYRELQREWVYLRHKYGITKAEIGGWRFAKMHSGNLPHVRIAEFASLYALRPRLLSEILLPEITVKRICEILMTHTSSYWDMHYSFGERSDDRVKMLGVSSALLLIINAVVPIMFSYGRSNGIESLCERALSLLEEVKAEDNSITRSWGSMGFMPANAYDSQALIQLQREYCDKKKCLFCAIGYRLLKIH
ncbi:MAG: DUF2851 family protein [Bacteroidales bacterium]